MEGDAAVDPADVDPAALYPVRAPVPWAEEEGAVVVLLPKRLDPLSRALRAVTRGPAHLRVPLDPIGSRAFLLADGTRTAGSLAEALRAEFGDRAGPPERVLGFLATLAQNGLLRLARAPVPAPVPGAPRALGCGGCGKTVHTADAPGTRLRCPGCGRNLRA